MHAYLVGRHIMLQALIIYKPLMELFNEAKAAAAGIRPDPVLGTDAFNE